MADDAPAAAPPGGRLSLIRNSMGSAKEKMKDALSGERAGYLIGQFIAAIVLISELLLTTRKLAP